ncbi:hypothetical protein [Ensifer aridi]|uniref:hypothetical protein n=1 Tax=Ensifer aridi TaxID=1708715 RepID=UPI00047BD802|nr:hypothetical protein [Ensifer aridi]
MAITLVPRHPVNWRSDRSVPRPERGEVAAEFGKLALEPVAMLAEQEAVGSENGAGAAIRRCRAWSR